MVRALSACAALAMIASACSVGLPDNLDDYLRSRGALKANNAADAGQQPMSGASSGACAPHYEADGGSASVPWQPPAPLHQNRCTDEQAKKVADCVINDPQTLRPDCRDFLSAPANQDCVACSITPASAPQSGALIRDGSQEVWPNVEGCVAAMSGDTSVNGCGPKMLARSICESIVCDRCTGDQDFYACSDAADKSLCSDRAAASSCADSYLPKCASTQSFSDTALILVRAFCTAAR